MSNTGWKNKPIDEINAEFANLDEDLETLPYDIEANKILKETPNVPANVKMPNFAADMASVPKNRAMELPSGNYTPILVDAAIKFASNPLSVNDRKDITDYLKKAYEVFMKNHYRIDDNEMAMAAVAAYLIHKTKKSGGNRKTWRNKKHHKLTRKRKQH